MFFKFSIEKPKILKIDFCENITLRVLEAQVIVEIRMMPILA